MDKCPPFLKRGRGVPTEYHQSLCLRVIEIAEENLGASLTEIAVKLGIARSTLYLWKDRNPDFSDALKATQEIAQVWYEEMGRKGMKGELPGFNATSMIFQMKNRFGNEYRDRKEHTGPGGGPIQHEHDYSRLNDDELRQYHIST